MQTVCSLSNVPSFPPSISEDSRSKIPVRSRLWEIVKPNCSKCLSPFSVHLQQYKSTEIGQRRKRGVTPTFRLLSRRDLPRFPIGPTHPHRHHCRKLVKVTQALTLLKIHPIPQLTYRTKTKRTSSLLSSTQ